MEGTKVGYHESRDGVSMKGRRNVPEFGEMGRAEFNELVNEHVETRAVGGHYPELGSVVTVSVSGRLIKIGYKDPSGEVRTGEERYGVNWGEFDQLTGRILTLCDATFTDKQQRKAFKDMVRQHIKEWVNAIAVDAYADAGLEGSHLTAPFVVDTQMLWGVEGEESE